MRTLICIASFLFGSLIAIGQSDEPTETLFSNLGETKLGAMAEAWYGYNQIQGADAHLLGVRAGAVFNRQLTLGGFYQQSVNQVLPENELLTNIYLDFWSAGGFVEYTLASNKLVHFSFPLFIGIGEVQMDNEDGDANLGEANFLLIEPTALMEVNLLKNIRLNIGAAYRFTSEVTYRSVDQNDLMGLRMHCGLKFVLE